MEGWLFSSQSPSCPAFPLLDGEQRACGLGQPCRSCGSQVGPGGAALCHRGDCLSGGGRATAGPAAIWARRVLSCPRPYLDLFLLHC